MTDENLLDRLRRLEDRLERERKARGHAEELLEKKSLALYEANLALSKSASELETRIEERTKELSAARKLALEQAETDALTKIANRAAFNRHLSDLVSKSGSSHSIILVDLDEFKLVNDTLGHSAGDYLLIEVAERLKKAVRPNDIVARLGGDEFSVIARDIEKNDGVMLARRIQQYVNQPVNYKNRLLSCSCSIGVAQVGAKNSPIERVLVDADLALYASKQHGRGGVFLFEDGLREKVDKRARLEEMVRQAVFAEEVIPYYQAIYQHSKGAFCGVEMLTRWPNHEGISTDLFIETVESLGLLDAMMQSLLNRALHDILPLVESNIIDYLSINISPKQFSQGWVQSSLIERLSTSGFPPRSLVIELTETAIIQDMQRTKEAFVDFESSGIRVALDDFGVGYSNLSILRQLPFHSLKIDRTLISDIHEETVRAIIECIQTLATKLDISTVAEGVETSQQASYLTKIGCATLQGFYYAKPCQINELRALLSYSDDC